MRKLASMSIRVQLLFLAFIVAIPALGIIVYSGIQMREESMNAARMETQRLADNIAAEQQNLIAAAQQLMIALTQLPEVKKQDKDRVEPILRDILKLNAQYSNIFIADRKGLVWATAVPVKPPFIVSDRRYFKKALASGQLSSGEFVISRSTTRPVFNVAYPLRNVRGAIVGVISVGFSLDAYKLVLERAKMRAGAAFVLLDHKGTVLYRPISPEEYIGKQFYPELFREMQEGPDVYTYSSVTGISGDTRITSYRKLRLPGEESPYMYIRAGIPRATVLADANKALIRNLSLFTTFLVLAVFFAWLIGKRSIADRITLLEKASRNLAEGNLQIRVSDLVAGGELGKLGQTFDEMARQLSHRQQALIESERNYRDIFNTTKDAIFLHDAESGNIVEINNTAEKLYGYSREEILKQRVNLGSGESPYSSWEALEWIHKAFKEGPQHFEWLSRRKNGELFWTEVVLSATQTGGAGRVLAVVRDIADRKRALEALQESEKRYRRITEGLTDYLYTVRIKNGRAVETTQNMACEKVTGYTSEDFSANPYLWIQMVAPEDRGLVTDRVNQLLEGKEIPSIEHRIIRKDGELRWVKDTTVLFKDASGNLLSYDGVIQDITERKRAEEALRERNAWINTILEASPVGIYSMDNEGIILTWNKGAEQLFGWSKEDVVGKKHPIVPEEELESFHAHRKKIQGGERILGAELSRRKKDGSPIVISLFAAPVYDASGAVTGHISVVIDITQQKKMEAEHAALEGQLRQAQKMEAVGQLGGGVAHDFNNILSAIVGYSHLSLMKMSPGDPNRHNIDQILASSERAAALTQRLLSFSRKQPVNLARIDVNDIIAKFEKFLVRLLREDIELKTILARMELSVLADRGQMEQVLMNLVTNARDAMSQGGRIIIETSLVELDQSFIKAHGFGREGDYALLSVTDTGIGISENIKDNIFEPFFTTKEDGKGTGLGLSMVYGIVKKHEGYINVYSQPGIGTTFKIYLPVVRVAAEAEEQKADGQKPIQGGTETVLIGEDDTSLRALTATVLRHFGYTVIEAVDGPDAVTKFTENRDSIRLVILDGIMPKMNGKAAWKEIKALSPGIKAIFISGYAEDIFTKDGIPDREGSFIQKPYPPLILVRKVRELLDE
jgi:two-component system cell cycle sensor histidine kinase/response regulator CckA